MTQDKFDVAFLGLCVTFGQKDNIKELAQVYKKFLDAQGFTDEDFASAVNHVMATHKYNTLPKPADLIGGVKGDPDTQALFAIETLDKAIRDHGGYMSIIFQDPILGEIVSTFEGGWPGLCACTTEELIWHKKHFEKVYRAKLASGSYGREPVKLIGTHEFSGNEDIKPVTIGGEPVKQIARDEREIKKLKGGC